MNAERGDLRRLLRWYPESWRARYGDEFLALLDDELGDTAPSRRYRRRIARAGLHERAHATGLVGPGANGPTGLRSGSLLVLCTWTLFVLGGIGFGKTAEHFARALPVTSRAPSQVAFNVVALLAVLSGVAIVLGAAATLPSTVALLRRGGWRVVRRHVRRAILASAIVAVALSALSLWAHHLNGFQRNGGDGPYGWAVEVLAVLVAYMLASWVLTAVAVVTRLNLSTTVLRFEAAMAMIVTAFMAAMTFAVAWWWNVLAANAPWFLEGAPRGTVAPGLSVNMIVVVLIMSVAVVTASLGVVRIFRSWRQPDQRTVRSR